MALCEVTTLPNIAKTGNVKSCLKFLSLPFPLSSQLPFRLPPQLKLPIPRAFLHPLFYVFTAVLSNNSCNLTKQFWSRTFKHLAYLSSNKQIDYQIQLSITISVLSIAASLLGPFLKVLNARHKFIPLGDFLQNDNVLFSQCRKKCVNPISLQVFFLLKFLQRFSDFIPWFGFVFDFKAVRAGYENPLFPAHFVERHFRIILFADFLLGI